MKIWKVLPSLALCALSLPAVAQILTAKVAGGEVAGTVADGLSIFKGIPFAAPPLGKFRWQAPQPVEPWHGVRQATAFGPACMQEPKMAARMGHTGALSEDCLYLNVWTPATSADEKRPVIVWIYGGGFSGGMTSIPLYDGANFAKSGVVFVSLTYRVGPFGFLASPALSRESGHGSGAYGMLDMIAGLDWVRDNVARFGGDPNRVTLLGHSAGAFAVSELAVSPLAKGLFEGVIAESGANFAPPSSQPIAGSNLDPLASAAAKGRTFLEALGANDLAAARALPAERIEQAADARGAPRFWPPLDGYVLPGDEVALFEAGRFNDTPILIGSTSDEAAAFGVHAMEPAAFEEDVRKNYGPAADAILAAYPHSTSAEATLAAKQLRRDTMAGWPAFTWASLQTSHGHGKAYVYYFDRPSARDPDGSPHGSEVALVFGNEDHRPGRPAWSDTDRAISKLMHGYWVNFAVHGNPNGPGLPTWPAFDPAHPEYMIIRNESQRAGTAPNMKKLEALDAYYGWRRRGASQSADN